MLTNECGCPYGNCDCEVVVEKHVCKFEPAKRGKHLVCSCGDRWPCADRDCGHVDCWDERSPVCHFCGETLKGEHNTEAATWASMVIRGKSRAAHYCCRDANGSTPKREIACRARGGYFPEPCSHTFEGKEVIPVEAVKQLAAEYRAE